MPTDQDLEFKQLAKEQAKEKEMVGRPDLGSASPTDAQPGIYGAKGDPYSYRLNQDGSVTIIKGPTGQGSTVKDGPILKAIKDQIQSGQLKYVSPPVADAKIAEFEDVMPPRRPLTRSAIEEAVSDSVVDRVPSPDLPPNVSTVR